MVNVEEFAKRLKIIIDYYEISASLLAEKMEIQRSSISHILSGRNKPSLEFVLKILKTFPEVELYWLLNGVGKFPKQTINKNEYPPLSLDSGVTQTKKISTENTTVHKKEDDIDRIVIFYKNGTFKSYFS
ncbi:helix-turn-helix transcriptional regulator [Lutibacter sp.]|uniref:helix-turn-helix domain-containing protein n=1 Tax=Lutibacter sp. TaxID=1925666 RepID=UPI0025BE85DD|nr:helix-turn-helix transcriptional regulator [Lutibacter sp.]MCF6167075.1 helix-turn-helix domain-containing protein [Lutibacter sp.]